MNTCLFCRKETDRKLYCSKECKRLFERVKAFIKEWESSELNSADVFYARDEALERFDIQGMVAYLIRCPRCIDKVLWMYGCEWKTVCHCTVIWDMAFDGNDKPVGIGRNPKK